MWAILTITKIETINAAGPTKLAKLITRFCRKPPIAGNSPSGVALVAIRTIEASKNWFVSLSLIFKKPTIKPRSNKVIVIQTAGERKAKIIHRNKPIRKAIPPSLWILIFKTPKI